ncbi:hypothetical protein FLP10_16670 [Agromyces intestinalis]|uniref:Uncharacterized protein n=1 Tax=Agromyces intestinalis TaxID=2592652 RepID=A0A5C1YLA2_9MICO|nr:hypothetical protein [Agromyces intestinalis]QEO15867.1 hypothetical protein FLP10_16670 [Agromyces intestinalis]
MKSVLWFIAGVAAGFVVAHQVNRTSSGREFFSSVDAKARAFGKAIAEGYHERDAELRADGPAPH